jgi:hypothetical protein
MASANLDQNHQREIMAPEEVAQFFHKSKSWVYKNWRLLGGRKLGGSLVFPSKEDLYDYLFKKGEGVEVRFHLERPALQQMLVQNQSRGQKGRGKKEGGTKEAGASCGDPNRHGLFGVSQ